MKRRGPRQRQRRHIDRAFDAHKHDPYLDRGKPRGPAACPSCGAVYRRGRWQWGEAPERARPHLCPACRRTKERDPAGTVRVSGAYFAEHRDELLALVRNTEDCETRLRPPQRVMGLREARDGLEVATTDVRVAWSR